MKTLEEFRRAVIDDYAKRGEMVDWVEVPEDDFYSLIRDSYVGLSSGMWCTLDYSDIVSVKIMGIDVRIAA